MSRLMDKTKEEFVIWIRIAINDRESGAYEELYQFLCTCFTRADKKMTGKVDVANFDMLVEEAAELPRRYGYAPKSEAMYPSEDLRKAARSKQLLEMKTSEYGYISLEEWVKFAVNHIVGKVSTLPKDYLGGSSKDVSKEEFIAFIKRAMDKKTPEFKELYHFLLRTFQAGDKEGYGAVTPEVFDDMIECAAAAPRRFGLAPKTSEMYKTENERFGARMKNFVELDKGKKGSISFHDWLNFAYDHILGKVSKL